MAYTDTNYKTKKALKAGVEISVFQPGPFGSEVKDGRISLEGPHYPAAHSWYASATIVNGLVVKVS